MTRRRVTITESGAIIVVRGWQVGALLRDGGFKATFSASAGGHMLDADRLADVLAYLEHRRIGVFIVAEPDGGDAR